MKIRPLTRTDFRLAERGGYSAPTPFRPPRAVPEMLCGARDFTVPKSFRAFWTASTNTPIGGSHPYHFNQKTNAPPKAKRLLFGGERGIRTPDRV